MKAPHVHATVIKAWADGHEVQFRTPNGSWEDVQDRPAWREEYEYRIKPTPRILAVETHVWCSDTGLSMASNTMWPPNIRFTFEGDRLIDVEMLDGHF